MTDSRPRPQYGEYASPEVQRAHIREPHPTPDEASPEADARATGSDSAGLPGAPVKKSTVAGTASGARRWDVVLTWVLLALGTFSVLTSIPGFLNLAETLEAAYQQVGIGHFASSPLASALGVTAVVIQVVLLVAAFALSTRTLRAGKVAFWIPLVAGVVSIVAVTICMTVALVNDPAFIQYTQTAPAL